MAITASASSESTLAPLDQFTNWYPSTGTAVKITSVLAATSCTSGYALHPAVSAAASRTAVWNRTLASGTSTAKSRAVRRADTIGLVYQQEHLLQF